MESGEVAPELQEQERQQTVMGSRFLAVRRNFAVANQALKERFREKPYFVDFQNVLTMRRELVYEPDWVHLKNAGREMVARELARVLVERQEF